MLHKAEGFVIRSMDYGEGNKILTLFTRQSGKISIMARGAKKIKSRHSAVTQLFTYGEFLYYHSGQAGHMGTLNHAEIIDSHHRLRTDIHMAAYASYLMELTDRIVTDNERNDPVFEQLKASLNAIETDKDAQIILHIFEMKMLMESGYLPRLYECVSCSADQGNFNLSVAMGGVLCEKCQGKDVNVIRLTPGSLKLLRLFQQIDVRRLGKIEVKPSTKIELKQCMRRFFDNYLDISFKSRRFIDQMEKYDF